MIGLSWISTPVSRGSGSAITAAPPLHRISNPTGTATQVFSDIVGQNPRYHRGVARDDANPPAHRHRRRVFARGPGQGRIAASTGQAARPARALPSEIRRFPAGHGPRSGGQRRERRVVRIAAPESLRAIFRRALRTGALPHGCGSCGVRSRGGRASCRWPAPGVLPRGCFPRGCFSRARRPHRPRPARASRRGAATPVSHRRGRGGAGPAGVRRSPGAGRGIRSLASRLPLAARQPRGRARFRPAATVAM